MVKNSILVSLKHYNTKIFNLTTKNVKMYHLTNLSIKIRYNYAFVSHSKEFEYFSMKVEDLFKNLPLPEKGKFKTN